MAGTASASVRRSPLAPYLLVGPGVIWLILFYVTNNALPVSALNNWNLLVGFGFIVAGFAVSTQWR